MDSIPHDHSASIPQNRGDDNQNPLPETAKKTNNTCLKVFTALAGAAAIGFGVAALTLTGLVIPLAIAGGVSALITGICLAVLFGKRNTDDSSSLSSEEGQPLVPDSAQASQNNIQEIEQEIIKNVTSKKSSSIKMTLNDSKWEHYLNSKVTVLGKEYTHAESGIEELNKAIESWAGNSPQKDQLVKFAKHGITQHAFNTPYTKEEEPMMIKLFTQQSEQSIPLTDVFQHKGFEFIEGQKVKATFTFKEQNTERSFSQIFSCTSVENDFAQVSISRELLDQ